MTDDDDVPRLIIDVTSHSWSLFESLYKFESDQSCLKHAHRTMYVYLPNGVLALLQTTQSEKRHDNNNFKHPSAILY